MKNAFLKILMPVMILAALCIAQKGKTAEKPSLPLQKGAYRSLTPSGVAQHDITYYDNDEENPSSKNPPMSYLGFPDISGSLTITDVHNDGNTYFIKGKLIEDKDKFIMGTLQLTIIIKNNTAFSITNANIKSKYIGADKFLPKNKKELSYQLRKE